jgi:CRISPR-associated protein Csd1
MIIQRLVDYYNRKNLYQQGETGVAVSDRIAPDGFEWKEIRWVIVLNPDGSVLNLEDTRMDKRAKAFLVPKAVNKTNQIKSNWFWDNPGYVLGLSKDKSKVERVLKCHQQFCDQINSIEIDDVGINAVKLFLNNPNKISQLENLGEVWTTFTDNMIYPVVFQLAGEPHIIPEYSIMCEIMGKLDSVAPTRKTCIISGVEEDVVDLHTVIKGIKNTKMGGTPLISFNKKSTDSWGKTQGLNSPIGVTTEIAYTRALNMLLGRDSNQKVVMGDTTLVFWAGEKNSLESSFSRFFNFVPKDNPDVLTEAVRHLYRTLEVGDATLPNQFYILGLVGEQGRISVRLWLEDTVEGISRKIKQHYDDIALDGVQPQPWMSLIRGVSRDLKDMVAPIVVSEFLKSILMGTPYSQKMFSAAITRNKVEGKVISSRASLIKGYLIRKGIGVTMGLDKENINIGYRLGRLFALLEKIQLDGMGLDDLGSKFYRSASSVPHTIFPRLVSRSMYHRNKLEIGRQIYFDRIQQEIMDGMEEFPSHLSLENQGQFAMGYYHQKSNFYTKKEVNENE